MTMTLKQLHILGGPIIFKIHQNINLMCACQRIRQFHDNSPNSKVPDCCHIGASSNFVIINLIVIFIQVNHGLTLSGSRDCIIFTYTYMMEKTITMTLK